VGDATVFLSVYGLALAPLGVGALSLPVRRALARRPLARARQGLRDACRSWGWAPPQARGRRDVARGTRDGLRWEVGIGPDPRSEAASSSLHAVWIRVRIDLTPLGLSIPPLLFDPDRGSIVHGPAEWAAVWLGLGLDDLAQPNDQLEIARGVLTFDRFASRTSPSPRALADAMAQIVARLHGSYERLDTRLASLVRDHPGPEVRLRCLRALLRSRRWPETARATARHATNDADPRVRLEAAAFCGDESVLLDIVGKEPNEDHRLQALGLLSEFGSTEARAAARRSLRDPALRVAQRALELADPTDLVDLARDATAGAAHRARALEVLEARDRLRALDTARALLGEASGAVRVAAVDALGRIGGGDDLAGIRAAGGRAPAGSELFIAARAALDLIRERTRAEAGRISIVGHGTDRVGAVSLDRGL